MTSRSTRLIRTGSLPIGRWPAPSSVSSSPPVAAANAAPCACGQMRSSSPWMTSTGQRMRASVASSGSPGAAAPRGPCRPASRASSRAPSRCRPRSAWSSAARCTPARRRTRGTRDSPAVEKWRSNVAHASPRLGSSSNASTRRSGSGTWGAMATRPSTRSGWPAASRLPHLAPAERPTSVARSRPVASITASASAVYSASAYADAPTGRSERPLPRPSKVTTRQWRARYGICAFQIRECTIDHAGSRSTAGPSLP